MNARAAGSPTSAAGFALPGVTYPWLYKNKVPFQFEGTSIKYVAPSANAPDLVVKLACAFEVVAAERIRTVPATRINNPCLNACHIVSSSPVEYSKYRSPSGRFRNHSECRQRNRTPPAPVILNLRS